MVAQDDHQFDGHQFDNSIVKDLFQLMDPFLTVAHACGSY